MTSDIVELAQSLISVPSTKDSPENLQSVLDLAKSFLPDFPFKSFTGNHPPSLLIYNKWPENGQFKILLNAHLDVVPAKPDQFSSDIKDGKLFGRGAIDMKAAAAAEIIAFRDTAAKVDFPLALQLVTDEEIGGKLGTKYQISQGIKSDFYLCGEYSANNICYETKGVLWLKLTAQGTRAHGAYLWNGVNAIFKLSKEIQSLSRLFPVPKHPVWKTTCNFGTITGGDTVNQVPDSASVTLDIRRIPTEKAEDIINQVKSVLVYPDTQVEIIENESCNHTDKNHPTIKKLDAAIKQVTGHKPKYVKFYGASDARFYSAVGTTAIDIGPAGEGLHSDNEWVDLHSLDQFFNILKRFILSL